MIGQGLRFAPILNQHVDDFLFAILNDGDFFPARTSRQLDVFRVGHAGSLRLKLESPQKAVGSMKAKTLAGERDMAQNARHEYSPAVRADGTIRFNPGICSHRRDASGIHQAIWGSCKGGQGKK